MKDLAPGWRVRCLTCGLAIDAGRTGIIRFGGRGKSYKLRWCSRCRRLRCFVVERKPPAPKCHKCGYNLRGNVSGRCPECGQPVSRTSQPPSSVADVGEEWSSVLLSVFSSLAQCRA